MNIMDEDWDVIIILDACRYDYFKKTYPKFLKGKLKKVQSIASNTPGWLKKTFKDIYKNIVYVSANPHINSKMAN